MVQLTPYLYGHGPTTTTRSRPHHDESSLAASILRLFEATYAKPYMPCRTCAAAPLQVDSLTLAASTPVACRERADVDFLCPETLHLAVGKMDRLRDDAALLSEQSDVGPTHLSPNEAEARTTQVYRPFRCSTRPPFLRRVASASTSAIHCGTDGLLRSPCSPGSSLPRPQGATISASLLPIQEKAKSQILIRPLGDTSAVQRSCAWPGSIV